MDKSGMTKRKDHRMGIFDFLKKKSADDVAESNRMDNVGDIETTTDTEKAEASETTDSPDIDADSGSNDSSSFDSE